MTKPNVVSEAPPGVARNAGGEGVDGRSPASKRRSRARERKCFAIRLASATGEGVRGTCATSPGAIRTGGPVFTTLRAACLFLMQCKVEYKTCVRLESGAEAYSRSAGASPSGSALQGCRAAFPGIVPTDFHGLARKLQRGRSALRALGPLLMQ